MRTRISYAIRLATPIMANSPQLEYGTLITINTTELRAISNPAESRSKATQLRALLTSSDLEFLMEAQNGLSAKIVEESEFKGIWASGLPMSMALGVRDNNEASWM